MADVFISYAREDSSVASRLGRLLEQEGWSFWIDQQIHLSEDFRPHIEREIDSATCVAVIWTERATASRWVRQEAIRALGQHKLVEIELGPGFAMRVDLSEVPDERLPAILMGPRIQVDAAREQLLARIAVVGRLARPCDSWNATLIVHNWRERPPSDPIIAWEWTGDAETRRLCRRIRWTSDAVVQYQTTIGNFWQFGYEGTSVATAFLTIRKPRHDVTLPPRNTRRERQQHSPLVISFTEGGTALELVSGPSFPSGGIPLERDRATVIEGIEQACREYLEQDSDDTESLVFVSDDTGDPFVFEMAIEMVAQPRVSCKLVASKRSRDREQLDRSIARLLELGWKPPSEGTFEGGLLLGRRLTEWTHDVGVQAELDYHVIATLIVDTFLDVYGAPPLGWTHSSSITN